VPGITDRVRSFCAAVAAGAEHVRIDADATVMPGGTEGLDPELHLLEAEPEDRARYVLILDALNFGSGWFDELGVTTDSLTQQLTEQARAEGVWSAARLRALRSDDVGDTLGLDADHDLTILYARSLNDLGAWLGDRPALEAIGDSADALAAALARMPFYADHFFYKRAQITANDLVHAGVARFADVDRLTVFADNLLPHVLRVDGVLHYSEALAAIVDAGEQIPAGHTMEIELRACAVHACERIARELGVPPRTLDNWLWNRGLQAPYSDLPAHRTRTMFY
jgi:putative queuosine salvage protein